MSCHGCCHSVIEQYKHKKEHFPSGELACGNCIRNPDHEEYVNSRPTVADNFVSMKKFKKMITQKERAKQREIDNLPVKVVYT